MSFPIGARVEVWANTAYGLVNWNQVQPGMRGVIASAEQTPPPRPGFDGVWAQCQIVDFDAGFSAPVATPLLRRIDDDRDALTKTSWDECPWKPEEKVT